MGRTYRQMLLAIASQSRWLRSLGTLHRHEQLLAACTRRVKSKEARILAALDACASSDAADAAFLV